MFKFKCYQETNIKVVICKHYGYHTGNHIVDNGGGGTNRIEYNKAKLKLKSEIQLFKFFPSLTEFEDKQHWA